MKMLQHIVVIIALGFSTGCMMPAQQLFRQSDASQILALRQSGTTDRFVVPIIISVTPGYRTTYILRNPPPPAAVAHIQRADGLISFYSRDELNKAQKFSSTDQIGDGSVLLFETDNITLRDWRFDGNKDNPLSFLVAKDKGLVYLQGRGVVTSPDGTKHEFK